MSIGSKPKYAVLGFETWDEENGTYPELLFAGDADQCEAWCEDHSWYEQLEVEPYGEEPPPCSCGKLGWHSAHEEDWKED